MSWREKKVGACYFHNRVATLPHDRTRNAKMLFIDEAIAVPSASARPTRLQMARDGVFVLQNHHVPGTIFYTTRGMLRAVRELNRTLRHLPLRRANMYAAAWGSQTSHRNFYVRYLQRATFDALKSSHPDVRWVDVGI